MSQTKNLKLEFLEQHHNQKDKIVNNNIAIIDSMCVYRVIDKLTSLPEQPADGAAYLMDKEASSDLKNNILLSINGGWHKIFPQKEMCVFLTKTSETLNFDGTEWQTIGSSGGSSGGGGSSSASVGDYKTSVSIQDHEGWLMCNGREISRTKYSELFDMFSAIKNSMNLESLPFGDGDKTATFNLPNFSGRFNMSHGSPNSNIGNVGGQENCKIKLENLPKITLGIHDSYAQTEERLTVKKGSSRTLKDTDELLQIPGSSVPLETMPPYIVGGITFIYSGVTEENA